MSIFLVFFFILSNWKACSGSFLIGTRVREGQFPWLIQFKTVTPCGGVLVSADWVLTAAQCVETDRQSISLQAVGLNGTGSLQVIRVLHAYIHPEYKVQIENRDHDYNIALIKLVEPFDLCDSKVHFLDIAPLRLDDNYKSCLIFGWQNYVGPSMKVFAKAIQFSQIVLNAWKYCIYMHKGNASFSNVFCTMIEADGDMKACAGNPGTPVVCEDQYQRMVLLGIASWTKFSMDCGELPTYLSVSIFRSWIYKLVFNDRKLVNRQKPHMRNANCKNEPQGGTHMGHFQNYTQLLQINQQFNADHMSGILEKARTLNIIEEMEKDSPKGVSEQSIILPTHEKNKIPTFDDVNDYPMISNNEDDIFIGNIKGREESLGQYQEVGQNGDDGEMIGSSAEHSNPKIVMKSYFIKKIKEDTADEVENPDDFDELLPFIFEEHRSSAFVNHLSWKYKFILHLSCLHILYR